MAIIFLGLATLGLFDVICNILGAAGQVICALLKYVILPFGLLFCICGIAKYGL